jgi:hypothetical protein
MAPVRRLTVIQNTSADDQRPPWQWIPIGVLFAVFLWAPLAMIAAWAVGKIAAGHDPPHEALLPWMLTVPPFATYALSCWAAGALVGRFGAVTGPKETALAGCLAGVLVSAIAALGGVQGSALGGAVILLLPVGTISGWIGGRFGVRRRRAAALRPPPAPSEGNV